MLIIFKHFEILTIMQNMEKSGYLGFLDLNKIAVGLNIEGCRPKESLPVDCDWINLIVAIDEPLNGITFDDIMESVRNNKYDYLEQAIVDFSIEKYIDNLVQIVENVKKSNKYKNILIHVHQYTGTTILDKTIELRTGVKTILDKTNFFDAPINYRTEYPDIDCLISFSQCASVDISCKAGTYIVSNAFMNYDVVHNIVYTREEKTKNDIVKYLDDIEYTTGNILVVNDLWNPTKNDVIAEGVLLLDENDENVLNFVKENTKIFDETHDWRHAIKVAYNSTKILNNKYVLYLALLHDVCDHKYTDSIDRSLLTKYIHDNLKEYICIDNMIENISFSKQKDFDLVDPILQAVRDGDRIEAIGKIGIERCIAFTKIRHGRVPEDVIIHCFDKLLRIYPEKYISTDTGRKNAVELHNHIVQYVRDNIVDYPDLLEKYGLPKIY